MTIYFNEFDKFAAEWIRNLYPSATVDERDVRHVDANAVAGFRRCHFFGGIAGWELALQLAGWTDERPVWTGSCPCQPLSCAGKRGGETDERHLWPEFYRLISECRPATIFGEQVASNDGLEWLDGVSLDLEELGYAVGTSDLPAAGVGAAHRRQRVYWVADSGGEGLAGWALESARQECETAKRSGDADGLANTGGERQRTGSGGSYGPSASGLHGSQSCPDGEPCAVADADRLELRGQSPTWQQPFDDNNDSAVIRHVAIECTDAKARRVEPGVFPLANGIPIDLGRRIPELRSMARRARANRVGRLKGYGNAISPQVAAKFIEAYMFARSIAAASGEQTNGRDEG